MSLLELFGWSSFDGSSQKTRLTYNDVLLIEQQKTEVNHSLSHGKINMQKEIFELTRNKHVKCSIWSGDTLQLSLFTESDHFFKSQENSPAAAARY